MPEERLLPNILTGDFKIQLANPMKGVKKLFWDKDKNNQELVTKMTNLVSEANYQNADLGNDTNPNNILRGLSMLQGVNATTHDGRDNSTLKEILDNPLKALETNEKLRNAVAAKGKQMGWNILPTNNVTSNKIAAHNCDSKVTNTDLGEIKLNEKIKVHQSGNTTDTINILMFGKSGCGQTTLLSYLTDNNQLIGTDSMSTQQFSAETFQLQSDTGMTNIRINESPGMCSGLEIQQLQEHWNNLISRVNREGGVNVFLLLIKSNERITSQFIDELEEFSELYFDEGEELWKRTVVVFTSIDELKGCNTLEDRINKLETQIVKPGMEKVKNVIDQTSAQCIYVSSIDHLDKQRVVSVLKDRLQSIEPREPQMRDSNNFSNEILESLSVLDIQSEEERVTDSYDHSSPKHSSYHISGLNTNVVVQYSETDDGINPQNSEYPDQTSTDGSPLMSFSHTPNKEQDLGQYQPPARRSPQTSDKITTQTIEVTNRVIKGIFPKQDKTSYDSNTNILTSREYSIIQEVFEHPLVALQQNAELRNAMANSGELTRLNILRPSKVDQIKGCVTGLVSKMTKAFENITRNGLETNEKLLSYNATTNSNLLKYPVCNPERRHRSETLSYNADEQPKKPFRDMFNVFEEKPQDSLVSTQVSKTQQPLVSERRCNPIVHSNGGNEHEEIKMFAKTDTKQIIPSKELHDEVSKRRENINPVLEQLSKEDLFRILTYVSEDEEGKKWIINGYYCMLSDKQSEISEL